MRTTGKTVWVGLLGSVATALVLTSCATTTPTLQSFRRSFVPPTPQRTEGKPIEQPPVLVAFYANEVPNLTSTFPAIPRPSDADFVIKKADDRFTAGKRALQEGRVEDARREFDGALEVLLTAPENLPGRNLIDKKIEDLAESIYRYDADQALAGRDENEVSFEQSPIDSILEMTFPLDPNLRNKVQEQIRATASQLPLEENDAVVSYINFFSSTRGKRILTYGLRRSGRYKPMIDRILMEEGVPEELIFLAQAESGFTPRAKSKALCVGIWQFLKSRGNEYGLKQTAGTDDRMDPDQATRAAARHLRDLYNHFGDWYLAMAAYNCGPSCIDRAIQRTGYADFWELRRRNVLPRETANYVPAILAMTIMAKNAKDYGVDGLDFEKSLEYETIELDAPTQLALIADAVDRPVSEIKELNPSVLRSVAPAGHSIHVPKDTLKTLEAALQVIPAGRRDAWRVHRLESGEGFPELAKRFNTIPGSVSSANNDSLPEPGAWVAIPVSYPGERIPAQTTPVRNSRKSAKTAQSRIAPTKSAAAKPVAAKGKAATSAGQQKTQPSNARRG
ncbi:MAG: transglycosylase SLT domain-containing protein [Bryobacteraceae bacterium]